MNMFQVGAKYLPVIEQPGFNGKYPRFFLVAHLVLWVMIFKVPSLVFQWHSPRSPWSGGHRVETCRFCGWFGRSFEDVDTPWKMEVKKLKRLTKSSWKNVYNHECMNRFE